jgi:PAS domain-containing protein
MKTQSKSVEDRRSRAAYLDVLAARALRTAARRIAAPAALEPLRSIVEQLVLEFAQLEDRHSELQRRLAASAAEREDLLAGLPVPCVVTDDDSNVVRINPEALSLLRVSERQIGGKPFWFWLQDRAPGTSTLSMICWMERRGNHRVRLAPRDHRACEVTLLIRPIERSETPLWQWLLLPAAAAEVGRAPVDGGPGR